MRILLLTAAASWLITLFLPWWALALPCLLIGAWLGGGDAAPFRYGFLGVGLLWLGQGLYLHLANDGLLTGRMAELFSLPHPLLVVAATALIGGLCGGLSTLTGALFRRAFPDRNASPSTAS